MAGNPETLPNHDKSCHSSFTPHPVPSPQGEGIGGNGLAELELRGGGDHLEGLADAASEIGLLSIGAVAQTRRPGPRGPPVPVRVSSEMVSGPTRSRQPSTICSGVRLSPWSISRLTMDWMPGRLVSPSTLEAKLMRSMREPLLIHSRPMCQPSTVGGLSRSMPMYLGSMATKNRPGLGSVWSWAMRMVPMTTSAGLFTLA